MSRAWHAVGLVSSESMAGVQSVPLIREIGMPDDQGDVDDLLAQCWPLLHEDERKSSAGLTGRRRTEWVLGRVAIKESVRAWQAGAGHAVTPASQIQVRVDDRGAPYVAGLEAAAPEVSLAHTRARRNAADSVMVGTVLAAANTPGIRVGIDVESRDRPLPHAARLLDEHEQSLIDDEFGAIGLLVAKEAAAKAAGTGLAGSLRRWPVLARFGSLVQIGDREGRSRTVGLAVEGTWIVAVCSSAWDSHGLASPVLN